MSTDNKQSEPWFACHRHVNQEKTAAIIGGGLAGCSTAWYLAQCGWCVILIEQHSDLASEASGNPQGILYAKLSIDAMTPLSQFILQGYHHTLSLLNESSMVQNFWNPCGVIQLAINEKIKKQQYSLNQQYPNNLLQYLDKKELSRIAGINIDFDGLYFGKGGWLSPSELCRAMTLHPNIKILTGYKVDVLSKKHGRWIVKSGNKTLYESKTVIIAQGGVNSTLSQINYIPLKRIGGQITQIRCTEESLNLTSCVCGQGYIAPATKCSEAFHTIGATFKIGIDHMSITQHDHQLNLDMQGKWFPALYHAIGGSKAGILGGRVGFRSTTPDYLPVVGPIVDDRLFIEKYAKLRQNRKYRFKEEPDYLEGLFITAGHGSRGLISCPLSGKILADIITGQDSTLVPAHLLNSIHPSRFLVKDLARNKI